MGMSDLQGRHTYIKYLDENAMIRKHPEEFPDTRDSSQVSYKAN